MQGQGSHHEIMLWYLELKYVEAGEKQDLRNTKTETSGKERNFEMTARRISSGNSKTYNVYVIES